LRERSKFWDEKVILGGERYWDRVYRVMLGNRLLINWMQEKLKCLLH
jgi:hypothetical protein